MRSETQSPCPRPAEVEILGVAFCGPCAREQEAYFAIGELTQEMQDPGIEPPGETLGETLDQIRRQRMDGLAPVGRLDFPSVDESERLALTESQAVPTTELPARDRRPNRMEHTSEDARVLIRAAKEVHAERHGARTFRPGTSLPFVEAAKRTGIRSDRQRYHDALEDLEYEGAIEWDESARYARGDKHYVITQRGLHDLGSAGTVAMQGGQQRLFEG